MKTSNRCYSLPIISKHQICWSMFHLLRLKWVQSKHCGVSTRWCLMSLCCSVSTRTCSWLHAALTFAPCPCRRRWPTCSAPSTRRFSWPSSGWPLIKSQRSGRGNNVRYIYLMISYKTNIYFFFLCDRNISSPRLCLERLSTTTLCLTFLKFWICAFSSERATASCFIRW